MSLEPLETRVVLSSAFHYPLIKVTNGIFNGTTTQSLANPPGGSPAGSFGSAVATASPSGNTFDFYSPPLSAAGTVATTNLLDGVVYVKNTGTITITNVKAAVKFYDYNPTTGTLVLILDTGAGAPVSSIAAGGNAAVASAQLSRSTSYSVVAGHELLGRITITFSGIGPVGIDYNGPSGADGGSYFDLPANGVAQDFSFGNAAAGPYVTFSASTAAGGTTMSASNNVTVAYTHNGAALTHVIYDGHPWTDEVDAGTAATYSAASSASGASERWQQNAAGAQPTFNVTTTSSTFAASYFDQLSLTVTGSPAAHSTPGTTGTSFNVKLPHGPGAFYDKGSTANATLAASPVTESGIVYAFQNWSSDASGTGLTSNNITMSAARTALANWKYQVSFSSLSAPTIIYGTGTTTVTGHVGDSVLNPSAESISITLNGKTLAVTCDSAGNFSATFNNTGSLAVGGYPITFAYAGDSLYTLASGNSTLTVNPKAITVTPDASQSKPYGASDPTLTFSNTALVGADTFSGALSRDSGESSGTYAITQGSLSLSSNYTLTFTSGVNFTITPRDLTVTPTTGQSKVYGAHDPVLSYTYGTLYNGDTSSVFSGALARDLGENVGNYAMNLGSLSAGPNYHLMFTSGIAFAVTPRDLTVTPTAGQGKIYGDTDPTLTYSYGTLYNGDTSSVFTGVPGRDAGENVSANYAINVGSLSAGSNYRMVFTSGVTFAITPRNLAVTPAAGQSKLYGDSDPTLAYAYGTLYNGDTSSVFSGALGRDAGENVGTSYAINLGSLSAGANYTIVFTTGVSFAITLRDLTVTPDAGQGKLYGASDPVLTYSYGALYNGDTSSIFTGALSRDPGESSGDNYLIHQGTLSAGSNYHIVFTTGVTFTIAHYDVTVTPDAGQSKVYGASDPTLTFSHGPLHDGDTDAIFTGALGRDSGEAVGGNYVINVGTLSAGPNYHLVFTSGVTFAITPRPITVTPDAGQSKVYGGSDPTLTFTNTPLVGSDTISGTLGRAAGENVASYAITQGSLSLNSNYTLTVGSGVTFGIAPKPISVTPDAGQNKIYGASDPTLTFTSTPLVGADSFSGALSRDSGEAVGNYAIKPGSLSLSSNYTLTVNSGVTFAVTPKPITVTPDSGQSKVYGGSDPTLTFTNTRLVGSDTFSGALGRAAGEGVGSYAITQGSLSLSSNYTLTVSSGVTFGITPKPISVTPDAGQNKIYGASDPTLTFTSTPLVGTDTFSGALGRAAGENVGNYAITPGNLSLSNNYTLTVASGVTFAVTPRPITVTPDAGQAKVYATTDPTLTYTNTPLLGSDAFSGALSRAAGEDAGGYAITQGSLALSSNYTLNFTTGVNFTIAKAPSTTTAYGDAFTYDGATHTGGSSAVTGAGGLNTTATLTYSGDQIDAGAYTVIATYAGDKNHTGSSATATITIAKAASVTKAYGDEFTYDGTAHQGGSSLVTGAGGLNTTAALTYSGDQVDTATYTVYATYAGDSNHTGSFDSATITIDKATTTTTVTGDTFTYNGTTRKGGLAKVTGAGGLSTIGTLTYSGDQVDAGTFTVFGAYAGDVNHLGSSGSASSTINKASSTTTAYGDTFTYDGTTHTGGSSLVTGAGGLNTTATLTYSGDQVNTGKYTVTATYAGDSNHTGSSSSATITINKASSVTVATGATFVYDGATHTGGSGTVTGAGGLNTAATSLTYTGDQVSVGTYYVTAHYAGDANHTASDSSTAPISITKTVPTLPTTAGGTVWMGTRVALTAAATLSGTVNGAGAVTFKLYPPGSTTAVYTNKITMSGNGTYRSTDTGTKTGSAVPALSGTYQWVVSYSGNANNGTAQGAATEFSTQNGQALSFYSSSSGEAALTGSKTGSALLSTLYSKLFASGGALNADGTYSILVDANGNRLKDANFKTYGTVVSYLNGATATNLANLLGAQLLMMEFNVLLGFVDPAGSFLVSSVTIPGTGAALSSTLQHALTTNPGTTPWTQQTTTDGGAANIQAVIKAAIASLTAQRLTSSSSADRTYQEALKDCLDGLDNNQSNGEQISYLPR